MRIAIDLDDTILNPRDVDLGKRMGNPFPGAKESIEELKRRGHEIIIFSYRAKNPEHVKDWLDFFQIPYDEITNIKGDFGCIIDDRAIRHTSWENTMSQI